MLELALRRRVPLDPVAVLLLPGDVAGGVLDHVILHLLLLVLVGPVVELPVQLAAVQVQDELPHLARGSHLLVLGEEIHVPEGVDGDQWQVVLPLAEVVQRVGELQPVRRQEVNIRLLSLQLLENKLT